MGGAGSFWPRVKHDGQNRKGEEDVNVVEHREEDAGRADFAVY